MRNFTVVGGGWMVVSYPHPSHIECRKEKSIACFIVYFIRLPEHGIRTSFILPNGRRKICFQFILHENEQTERFFSSVFQVQQ